MTTTRRQILNYACTLAGAWVACGRVEAGARGLPPAGEDVDAFLAAVKAGEVERVRASLERDPSLARAVYPSGWSAFVMARCTGNDEIAELLKARGLELDIVEAVLDEDWERVVALAEANPELANAHHPIGGNPLYAGALMGSKELYRLRAIGCDSNLVTEGGDGFSPAGAALLGREPLGALLSLTDVLSNGGHANVPQIRGRSLLHMAVDRRDPELVRLLLRKGADVEALDAEERTPLEWARHLEWEDGARLLEDHASVPRDHRATKFLVDASRAPIERPDISDIPQELQSETTGSSHGRLEHVKKLLAEDPRRTFSISTDDELAIEACGHTGNKAIMQLHLDHGAPLSLPTAISLGNAEHARFLLERDANAVHERGPHDFALMWYTAISGDDPALAELLLEFGAPIDQESVGTTALHWAARRNRPELARYLIERGAALDAVGHQFDRAGQTPLQVALAHERPTIAEMLRAAGA